MDYNIGIIQPTSEKYVFNKNGTNFLSIMIVQKNMMHSFCDKIGSVSKNSKKYVNL